MSSRWPDTARVALHDSIVSQREIDRYLTLMFAGPDRDIEETTIDEEEARRATHSD